MDSDNPSRTAYSAARYRAVHQVVERGVVLQDPLAVPIVGQTPGELAAYAAENPERRPMRWFICSRSRFAEDCAADAVQRGVRQLVVLGAGLDTFGYRNPYPDLRVIELDHPATQRWKLEMLAAAGIDPSPVRHRAIDFERDELAEVLGDVLEPHQPVLFWWLGVTPYLTTEAVHSTLATLGRLTSTAVVFDHAAPLGDMSDDARQRHQRRRDHVAALGEPWISEFTPDQLQELLTNCGFTAGQPVHELTIINRALGRTGQTPPTPSHLMWASTGWPDHLAAPNAAASAGHDAAVRAP
ncbi:MAG TPA: SAM-dependent methyltransferase [Nakamurella sp.]|nr:SAM-dependent methyltransferase [Nakamurella sp.]